MAPVALRVTVLGDTAPAPGREVSRTTVAVEGLPSGLVPRMTTGIDEYPSAPMVVTPTRTAKVAPPALPASGGTAPASGGTAPASGGTAPASGTSGTHCDPTRRVPGPQTTGRPASVASATQT